MYATLQLLDLTAEAIELTYELGSLTRKHLVPALVAMYVAVTMTVEYLRRPGRAEMIKRLTAEWESISNLDPVTQGSDTPDFVDWLHTLSDDELRAEFSAI
jgi:hypothetical protein